jgi:hypothetical protein
MPVLTPNEFVKLSNLKHNLKGKWIKKDTAVLIVHGIGNQNPLETIDQFGRELLKTLRESASLQFKITHGLAKKERSDGGGVWFDNFIRIEQVDDSLHPYGPRLDVFEYYWANMTEDQMDLRQISTWVGNVTSGARQFYRDNRELGQRLGVNSTFFRKGKFQYLKYMFFIYFVCAFIPALGFFWGYFLKWLSNIPFIGIVFRWLSTYFMQSGTKRLTNVIGDITVYNTTDEKSKFYPIRQEILTGAVEAVRYLLEPHENLAPYGKVILAGHSLGTQIAYDAVNRLIHLVTEGEVTGYNKEGKNDAGTSLQGVFAGFVTFGSPLDKIAFFLREQVPHGQFIREQLLLNFHCFKQRDWNTSSYAAGERAYPIAPIFKRLLDNMPWKNYYDKHDYISGGLDFYQNLTNVDCEFKAHFWSFTHNRYWECKEMFEDILAEFVF